MTSDLDLLRQFTRENSQDAFGEIVRRHLDLVYSAALRQVRSPQLAEDVAQSVFADLARDARKLKPDTVLTAWLYSVARRTAIDTVRKETRRQLREQIAVEMNDMNATADDWAQIAPLLDDAMAALDETDRTAILLRYFQNKSLREVGESLKISDDAAQKRVSRAVESLREFFSKQRLTIGAGGLVVLISANAVQSAPAGLAANILTATLGVTSTIGMTMIHKILIAGMTAVAIGTGVYAFHLQSQVKSLLQQDAPLNDQIVQLQAQLADATNQLEALQEQNEQLQAGQTELLRLRGEVTRLRNGFNTPAVAPVETNSAQAAPIEIDMRTRFISIPQEDVPALGLEWAPGTEAGGRVGLLTEQQRKALFDAFEQDSDIRIIAAPEVQCLNGQQAQMRVTRSLSLNGTNVEVGSVLDSTCYFSTNSSLFNLDLGVTYIVPTGDFSQPGFQIIQMTNHIMLSPIQTAVLETEIPPGAYLPNSTNAPATPQSLLVFVTPQVAGADARQNFRLVPATVVPQ